MKQKISSFFRPIHRLAVLFLMLTLPLIVFADDIANNLDSSVDAVAEVMPLVLGGSNGSTRLYIVPRNGDGKNGCNLTGGTTLTVSVTSSNPAVATVSPASITFTSCVTEPSGPTLTVSPVGQGSATISLSQVSNNTGGTFQLSTATFVVNVAPPPNTPPTISVTGVTGGASYEIGSVPAAGCSVVDAEDGNSTFPATLTALTGPLASFGLGTQTASCSYTDGGGLTASAAETYGIVDTIAPVITFINNTPAANSNGWHNSDVTVNWSCSDSGSGVVSTGISQIVGGEGSNQSATGTCEDHAGNITSDTQSGINIDKTAPTASASAAPAPNGNGWNNSNVTVSFSGSDGLSGVDSCSGPIVLSSEGASQSASGSCTDLAGNSASASATGINIDKTAPVVTVTGVANGASYILGSVPAAGCSTTDALSGVATTASLSQSGGPVGAATATCSGASDIAGNFSTASTASYSVIYSWSGFLKPVDNLPTLNLVKAGSAIPVKFSLAGNQGLSIFMAGYPISQKISCDSVAAVDAIEETVNAGSSSLSYDATADQYNYVWKTDKSWGGTCRQLTVRLIDGTTYSAIFKFTK